MAYEPAFAYHFGLKPWDIDRLTVDQFSRFRRFADDLNRQHSPG